MPATIAITVLAMFGHRFGLMDMAAQSWVELVLSLPVVLWAGWPFFVRGWTSVRTMKLNMFTLIAMGTGVAWLFSVVATVLALSFLLLPVLAIFLRVSPGDLLGKLDDGVVRDALIAAMQPDGPDWSLPVVGETWDGLLNDIDGFHVTADHVDEALAAASGGAVPEGNVGGGTGMVCHEFKGGIGTASRIVDADSGGFTVGVLVQANYGRRDWLRVDGVPVGEAIPVADVPSPYSAVQDDDVAPPPPPGSGSIIVIVATDAPLLPHQCERLAQRAGLGIARMGGTGAHSSGDLFLCFATGNRTLPGTSFRADPRLTVDIRVLNDFAIGALFDATIEATEEAILNALVGGATMIGRDGITAHALPHDRLLETMARFGRPARPMA